MHIPGPTAAIPTATIGYNPTMYFVGKLGYRLGLGKIMGAHRHRQRVALVAWKLRSICV
jgi:hypothetical protein